MSRRQVESVWDGMCTKLHNKLVGDVVTKVDAYEGLRDDLPPLLTLAAFKNSVQGGDSYVCSDMARRVVWGLQLCTLESCMGQTEQHPRAFRFSFLLVSLMLPVYLG